VNERQWQKKVLLLPGDAVYYDSNQPHLVKSATKTTILAVLYTSSK
jgi:quercetin dioxygenase-like cupin family protein